MRSLQLLAFMALLAIAAKADLFLGPYSVIPCGGPGQVVCSIVQGGETPTAQDLQGLDNAAFEQFFETNLGEDAGPDFPGFGWSVTGASADGYVIGHVSGGDAIDTQFIYHDGQVLCCIVDEPYFFAGINDQGVIIGWDPESFGPFIALASMANVFAPPEYVLTFTDPSFDPYGPIGNSFFDAIDNQNRILLNDQYMLVPTPEPASLVLLGIGLIFCAMLLRSRMRRPTREKCSVP